jgi:quercetin dioxygenase-like cupin family protein
MQINRTYASPGIKPPELNFVGEIRICGYFERESPSCLAGAAVIFAPGARTPWKVNPLGQTLIVTSGVGWAQVEGEPLAEIRAGDVVWCPPGRRHSDGATPYQAMTYVAVQEVKNGRSVQFGEKVSAEEYGRGFTRLT